MKSNKYCHCIDVLIIGSGAAGITAALHLADFAKIALLSKGSLTEGNTLYAQGGIAAVMADDDSIDSHIEDTLNSGAGLCDPGIVKFVVANAKSSINWLISQDIQFTKIEDANGNLEFHLTKEGGHSRRRILHSNDATGSEIENKLATKVRHHKNIKTFLEYTVVDLIIKDKYCIGLYALNNKTGKVEVFSAKFVIIATGGASKVYLYTSNPDCSSGDGIAIAHRAGCKIKNMEFNQFHPTCLYHPEAKSFLITEALRGEGGKLLLPNGKPFMQKFDKRKELAPRDIVARAIDHEMKKLGINCVYLDISHKPSDFIISHFPTVYKNCLKYGYDITKQPIPVVPAAHYTCGGVVTDKNGRTNIKNLYAIGESACTGLHGANRMASNSLLECIVFAISASKDIKTLLTKTQITKNIKQWDASKVTDSDEEIVVTHNWGELRRLMWDYVGIVRTNKRLERAKHRIELLKKEIQEYYGNFRVTKNLLELRNLIVVADLIVKAAVKRKENIGLHYNLDNII